MVTSNDLKDAETKKVIALKDRYVGYLVCTHCHGYYQLQEGESPNDFESCECGSPLVFNEELPDFDSVGSDSASTGNFDSDKSSVEGEISRLDSEFAGANNRNEEIVETLESVIIKQQQKHQVSLPRVKLQEQYFKESIDDKWSLWDVLGEEEGKMEFSDHKIVFKDIVEKNRQEMLRDEKKVLSSGENKIKTKIRKIGVLGFLSAAAILLITVYVLT